MFKSSLLKAVFFLGIGLASSTALAGFVEVGLSGSYRRSNLDEANFEESKSVTGSFSYYFMAMSALELSYTKGLSTVKASGTFEQTTQTEYELTGLDFVLSVGQRESSFRPYLKLGVVYIHRKILITTDIASPITIEPDDGIAPSAGIGVKIVLDKRLSLKLGVESWTSPLGQEPVEYNYTGRAGISWIF